MWRGSRHWKTSYAGNLWQEWQNMPNRKMIGTKMLLKLLMMMMIKQVADLNINCMYISVLRTLVWCYPSFYVNLMVLAFSLSSVFCTLVLFNICLCLFFIVNFEHRKQPAMFSLLGFCNCCNSGSVWFLITPPLIDRGRVLFLIDFFVYLFLCQQDYEKMAGLICMKFSVKVWSDHGTTWLHFWPILRNCAMPRLQHGGGVCCASHHSLFDFWNLSWFCFKPQCSDLC